MRNVLYYSTTSGFKRASGFDISGEYRICHKISLAILGINSFSPTYQPFQSLNNIDAIFFAARLCYVRVI